MGRRHRYLFLLGALVSVASSMPAREVATRVYTAIRIEKGAGTPVIDGVLDEAVWEAAPWSGGFLQYDPANGEPPTGATEIRILYDNDALYIAFYAYDVPEQTTAILARRDVYPGDWVEVNLDSYFDHRTAFSFTLSLSGSMGDQIVSEDGDSWDLSWDPIWQGATCLVEDGWTAEMRIPLSQLRFSGAAEQTWGLQFTRNIYRNQERSTWQYLPKDVQGWVSNFGELRGLKDLQPKRRVELLPYGVVSSERFQAVAGNPFRDGSTNGADVGLDAKIGITSNFTLDLTLNPDFGQVEADPSIVNLTEFETLFPEQRPFFVEGKEILDLRVAPVMAGGDFASDTLFYSRRIGSPPSYRPHLAPGELADMPAVTTIAGAFKLSGKTGKGLSAALLGSVTEEEDATIDSGGQRRRLTVEPLTRYLVGRLQQDFHNGDSHIGGMVTAVDRSIDEQYLEQLPEKAYAGGVDFSAYLADRDYQVEVSLLGSSVSGSAEAISLVQRSSAHYYQRPDNESATYDPTRTSLSGHAGSIRFSRTNNHKLVLETGVAWRSPGFEINDLGYMQSADAINQFTLIAYQQRQPTKHFDLWEVRLTQWLDWDFSGRFLRDEYRLYGNARLHNKYELGLKVIREGEYTSNSALRGGPSSLWPGRWSTSAFVRSDPRRDLSANFDFYIRRGDNQSSRYVRLGTAVTYRPSSMLQLVLHPLWIRNRDELQYIATTSFDGDPRYLLARLDQETLQLTLRADLAITANLTVQLYAAPFISTGRYTELKRITEPRAAVYDDRYRLLGPAQLHFDTGNNTYAVDEDMNGVTDYRLSNPDYDFREMNSNLVVRWQFHPGSTLFLVWSQMRGAYDPLAGPDDRDLWRNVDHLFKTHPHNVFLLKVSKWFSL